MSNRSETPAESADLDPEQPVVDDPVIDARSRRVQLPALTVGVFLAFAAILWLNAAVNRYRFNVALAVLGSMPLLVLLIRGAVLARHADRPVD